eukprot:101179_1
METNINQICFCGKSLKKYQYKWDYPCNCCCKQYNSNEMEFYDCGPEQECDYWKISTVACMVCEECFNSKDYDLKQNDNDFILNKTKSNMQIISNKMKQLTDIEQRKQYMISIYDNLYDSWIAKLQNQILANQFNEFYEKELEKIKDDVDVHELELNDDIFVSNSNKQFKSNQLKEINK